MTLVAAFIAAFVGIFVGGLINALADDLPHYRSPSRPHYPDGTPRPITAWLGITAFLLRQRCSSDKTSCLSWRYPITELTTALGFFVTVVRAEAISNGAGFISQPVNTTQIIFWLFYMAVFVLIFVIDVEHRLILFVVIIPASIVAFVDMLITPTRLPAEIPWWMATAQPNLQRGLYGALVGFITFFLFYLGGFVYQRASAEIRGWAPEEVPFGYGDVMLITFCGLVLGWRPLIFAMFLTVFLGAAGALFFLTLQKVRRRTNSLLIAIPYGPYIIIGAVIMLLFSSYVQQFIARAVYG